MADQRERDLLPATDEELILKIRQGDTLAEELLYERYKPIVRMLARAYYLAGADREDLIQEGMYGLYRAVCTYDPASVGEDRAASFSTYAEICTKHQMISAVRKAARKRNLPLNTYISLEREVTPDGETVRDLAEILSDVCSEDPEHDLIHQEELGFFRKTMDTALSPFERRVLKLYLEGFSYQKIAELLSKTPKSVDNAIQRMKRKLEEPMKKAFL